MTNSTEGPVAEEHARWVAPKPYASDVISTHPDNTTTISLNGDIARPYGGEYRQEDQQRIEPAPRTLTKVQRYRLREETRERVHTQTVTSRQTINPRRHVSEEQREAHLNRVLAGTDRLVRVNADRIQEALTALTPAKEHVILDMREWHEPSMSSQEAVVTLSAWAHMGDTLRETIRDSRMNSTVVFEGTKSDAK